MISDPGNSAESQSLTDNPTDLRYSSPATRMGVALSKALGHQFEPPPSKRQEEGQR